MAIVKKPARDNKTRQTGSNGKNTGDEKLELEKRYQEIIQKLTKEADGVFSEIEVRNDVETVREADEEHPGHRTQPNEEAGSIVLNVGHDMNVKENNDRLSGAVCYQEFKQEETNEAAEDVEIGRLVEERITAPKEEKQRLKEVSKQTKNASGT